jgi:hypothetical protein
VNCAVPPIGTCAEVGDTLTTIGATSVTVAMLDLVGSALEVAVTKTIAGLGKVAGAV